MKRGSQKKKPEFRNPKENIEIFFDKPIAYHGRRYYARGQIKEVRYPKLKSIYRFSIIGNSGSG